MKPMNEPRVANEWNGMVNGGGRAHFGDLAYVLLIAALIAVAGVAAHSPSASGQELANAFGGFSSNPDAPIDIEADRLDVNDVKKTAIFTGNVKATQDDFVLRSKALEVLYTGNAQSSSSKTEVTRLKATGKVLVTSRKDQSATSDWADFDVKQQEITLGGDVVVTQGKNVIRGQKLVIDLKTGRSRFESPANFGGKKTKPGRIRMVITKSPERSGGRATSQKKQ